MFRRHSAASLNRVDELVDSGVKTDFCGELHRVNTVNNPARTIVVVINDDCGDSYIDCTHGRPKAKCRFVTVPGIIAYDAGRAGGNRPRIRAYVIRRVVRKRCTNGHGKGRRTSLVRRGRSL